LIDTAHDVSAGGEAVALAEMALSGGLGLEYEEIEIEPMINGAGGGRADTGLFGEGGISFIVAVPEERWEEFQNALPGNVPYDSIAVVGGDRFRIEGFIDLSLDELREAHEGDLFDVSIVPEELG
jgi:phosphoribosylformylglycinamidine synthase